MYLSCLYLNPRNSKARRDLGNCHEMHRTVMKAFPDGVKGPSRSKLQVLYYLDASNRESFPKIIVQSQEKPNWSHLKTGYTVNFSNTNPSDENPSVAVKEVDYSAFKLKLGQKFHFRLKANVTKKVDSSSKKERLAGKKSNGRRMPLYKEEDQIKWLLRKAEQHGFKIQEVQLRKELYHADRFSVDQIFSSLSESKESGKGKLESELDLSKINAIGMPEGKFAGFKIQKGKDKDATIEDNQLNEQETGDTGETEEMEKIEEKPNGSVKKKMGKKRKMTFFSVVFDGILEIVDSTKFLETLENGIGPAKAYGFGLLMLS